MRIAAIRACFTVDDEINVPLVLVLDQPNGRLAPVQHPNIAALQKIQLVKEHLSLTLRTHTAICNNTLLTSKKAQVALTGGCQAVRAVTRALRWRQQRCIDAEQAPLFTERSGLNPIRPASAQRSSSIRLGHATRRMLWPMSSR